MLARAGRQQPYFVVGSSAGRRSILRGVACLCVARRQACLERDFHRLIAFFEFDPTFHKVIRTTNVIECSFKEIRRRLKVMGYFQNAKSSARIVLSQFYYFNAKWDRRAERIESIGDYFRNAA